MLETTTPKNYGFAEERWEMHAEEGSRCQRVVWCMEWVGQNASCHRPKVEHVSVARLYGKVSNRPALNRAFLRVWRTDTFYSVVNMNRRRRLQQLVQLHPALVANSVVQSAVEELREFGIAKVSIFDLPDARNESASNLVEAYDQLLSNAPEPQGAKRFIRRLIQDSLKGVDNLLWSDLTKLKSLQIISGLYMNLLPELTSLKVWQTFQTDDVRRTASQVFHRDFNDRTIIRAFIYFGDVGKENGGTEFVRGSHTGGGLATVFADRNEMNSSYADDEEVESRFGDKIVCAEGSVGDIYFVDTAGLHRGGYHTVNRDRRVALLTFSSAADLMPSSARRLGTNL